MGLSRIVKAVSTGGLSEAGGFLDSITGADKAADAAREAAAIQAAAGKDSIAFQKESRDLARSDLEPFKKAGTTALPTVEGLINDPNKKLSFIENNPFFDALAKRSTDTLLNNQAAKGKVGSGGTAEALQNSLLLLGNNLVNENINQNKGLVDIGLNAAAGQGTITQNTSNSVADTITGIGNANAAGVVGAANAITQGRQGLLQLGGQAAGAFAVCDIRAKENIRKVGKLDNGLPLYLFNYKGNKQLHINVMAQDVEKVLPHAVKEINGTKIVNMEKVWQ